MVTQQSLQIVGVVKLKGGFIVASLSTNSIVAGGQNGDVLQLIQRLEKLGVRCNKSYLI